MNVNNEYTLMNILPTHKVIKGDLYVSNININIIKLSL